MREDTEFIHHVVTPDNIGVFGAGLNGRGRMLGRFATIHQDIFDNVLSFVFERAVVSIGHTVDIKAEHFATAGDEVNTSAFDSRGGKQAEVFPVIYFAGGELGHDQLPKKVAGFFVKDHENTAV